MERMMGDETPLIVDMLINTYLHYVSQANGKNDIKKDSTNSELSKKESETMNPSSSISCLEDIERLAKNLLPRQTMDYYSSGADEERTLGDNKRAFGRYIIRPRFMRDLSSVMTSSSLLGVPLQFPVCIAPTAMHKMAHPDGEIAVAKAADAFNIGMTLSTISTTSLEDVVKECPNGLKLLQLYVFKDRGIPEDLIRRAETAGYSGIVLTIDTPSIGKRRADERNSKFKLPSHLNLAHLNTPEFNERKSDINVYISDQYDKTLTWADVGWVKSITKLPVIVKGVLTGEDADLAVESGADGILVSNHGGRQLDSTPATIDALPEVVSSVKGRVPVYLDGGVRTGTDVLKAIGLGADAVFIGRPIIYGLAYDGEAGVKKVLQILKDEFETAMKLSGCRNLKEIRAKNLIVHESYYRHAKL